MILKETDVKVITDLMMGGDGSNIDDEIGELHLSAISEAMNQMMGASATSLSTMLGTMIDISPPEASRIDLMEYIDGGAISSFLSGVFVKITFRMQIGELVDSTIMQLYPSDFARALYETFISTKGDDEPAAAAAEMPAMPPMPEAAPPPMPMPQMPAPQAMPQMAPQQMPTQQMPMGGMDMSQMQMGMPQMQMGMPQMGMPMQMMQPMNIQPAQFSTFTTDYSAVPGAENINLIMDVPLEVTVELGRCVKSISEILDFSPGTIIELDKIAGEPIDVLVNGKFVAKGEVVVIEESVGVRVTEIVKQ
jgi:flagellar motor switch protein FliN/FliY